MKRECITQRNKKDRSPSEKKKKTLYCRLVLHDKRNIFNNPKKWTENMGKQKISKEKGKKNELENEKKADYLVDSVMSFLASGMSSKSLTACTYTYSLSFFCVFA